MTITLSEGHFLTRDSIAITSENTTKTATMTTISSTGIVCYLFLLTLFFILFAANNKRIAAGYTGDDNLRPKRQRRFFIGNGVQLLQLSLYEQVYLALRTARGGTVIYTLPLAPIA